MPFAIIIFLYIQDLFIKHTRPKLTARIFPYGVPANPCDSLSIPWILVAFSFGQFAITKTLSRSYFLSTNPTKFLLLTWPSWCWRHLSLREMLFTLPTRPTANTRRLRATQSTCSSHVFTNPEISICNSFFLYRQVASSRPVYYSILNSFGQRHNTVS